MDDVKTRREFLRQAVLAGAAIPFAGSALRAEEKPARPRSANERLDIGVIGVGGRGRENLNAVAGENIAVLCDVDRRHLDEAQKAFPQAKAYEDFRRVLDHTDLDAVVISTPDHMHAIPAVRALEAGMDVYCEKPLAHSVHEVRAIREAAARNRRITQLGTQIHAGDNYRRAVEIIRAGLIGPVKRVHVWQETRPAPGKRVAESTPPEHVNYDLWIGPAPYRPYHQSSFHFTWRWWWDFGGGALADMACHYMDLPHWALGLEAPVSVEAIGRKEYEGENDVPSVIKVDYHHAARGERPPVHLTWYGGGWKPEGADVYGKGSAALFEGEKGMLLADYGSHKLFLGDSESAERPERSIPPSIGHHREWIEAVKSRGPTTCAFDYSGALTETVLLGNVAYRLGRKIEWDTRALKATNAPEAARYLRREYRKGWSLEA